MFIVVLRVMYLQTTEWQNVHIHTLSYSSAIKKKWSTGNCYNVEENIVKWEKPDKKTLDIVWSDLYKMFRIGKSTETESKF